MCGLFGFIGDQSDTRVALLMQALCIVSEVRGKHSTGLLLHETPYRSKLIKRAIKGSEFVSQGNAEVLFKVPFTMALGHTRHATKGVVNDRNAHPFPLKINIKGGEQWDFGMQNGTVGKAAKVAKEFKVKEADVDSETCLNAIAAQKTKGVSLDKAIDKVVDFISMEADFAFAYIDSVHETLYLWRNLGRPLSIIDARPYGMGRWFCSTKEIFLAAWGTLRGFLGDPKDLEFFEAYPYRLYKVSVDGTFEVEGVKELTHKIRPVPSREPVEYAWDRDSYSGSYEEDPRAYRGQDYHQGSLALDGKKRQQPLNGYWQNTASRLGVKGLSGM